MKRCEDIYRHRDITKMKLLLKSYMDDYRACDYYDMLLDSFKLIMIQKNGLDLDIIRMNKLDDPCSDSPSKLARFNSIMRQPSHFDIRKKSVSFNDCDTEIIYEEQGVEPQSSSDQPANKPKKRSPPGSTLGKPKENPTKQEKEKPTELEKEQQKRNFKRVEENMKLQDEKMKQRTCWYKDSCECNVF